MDSLSPGTGQFDAGLFAGVDQHGARAGLAAELRSRLSPGWSLWGRGEAAYDTRAGWYARALAGLRGRW